MPITTAEITVDQSVEIVPECDANVVCQEPDCDWQADWKTAHEARADDRVLTCDNPDRFVEALARAHTRETRHAVRVGESQTRWVQYRTR